MRYWNSVGSRAAHSDCSCFVLNIRKCTDRLFQSVAQFQPRAELKMPRFTHITPVRLFTQRGLDFLELLPERAARPPHPKFNRLTT